MPGATAPKIAASGKTYRPTSVTNGGASRTRDVDRPGAEQRCREQRLPESAARAELRYAATPKTASGGRSSLLTPQFGTRPSSYWTTQSTNRAAATARGFDRRQTSVAAIGRLISRICQRGAGDPGQEGARDAPSGEREREDDVAIATHGPI